MSPLERTLRVLDEVHTERVAQDEKWGEQNHPLATGDYWRQLFSVSAQSWKDENEWRAEEDPAKCRAEMIQVAAVAVAIVECIDRSAQRA